MVNQVTGTPSQPQPPRPPSLAQKFKSLVSDIGNKILGCSGTVALSSGSADFQNPELKELEKREVQQVDPQPRVNQAAAVIVRNQNVNDDPVEKLKSKLDNVKKRIAMLQSERSSANNFQPTIEGLKKELASIRDDFNTQKEIIIGRERPAGEQYTTEEQQKLADLDDQIRQIARLEERMKEPGF